MYLSVFVGFSYSGVVEPVWFDYYRSSWFVLFFKIGTTWIITNTRVRVSGLFKCIQSSQDSKRIVTVANGGSNDIYDGVSSEARDRALVDLREIFAIY